MKKFIKKIVILVFVFVLINVLYLFMLQKFDYNFVKSIEASSMSNQKFDCLVFGNSYIMDGIDTEFLSEKGLNSYNFAIGGGNLKSNYIQLKHYLNKNNNPKVILLGYPNLNAYDKLKVDESIHPIVEYNYGFTNFSDISSIPLLKYKWLAVELLKLPISSDHRSARIIKGQYRISKKVRDNTSYPTEFKEDISISDIEKSKYLNKIINLCARRNIELFVLGMPGYKKSQNKIPLGLKILENKKTKIKFINLNNKKFIEDILDPNEDWLANSHLNEFGAIKVTKYLYNNYLIQEN